jgi:uncharacterized membrane protein HdeD (DUF308 family)
MAHTATERPEASVVRDEIDENRGWFIVLGVLLILAGIAALLFPLASSLAAEIMIGIAFLVAAAAQITHAFGARRLSGFLWQLLGGILFGFAGIVLLVYPLSGLVTLTLFLAVVLVVEGIFRVITAFRIRPRRGWGWILTGALLGIAAGVLIFLGFPVSAVWALGVLVGINLLFAGTSFLALAMSTPEPWAEAATTPQPRT